MKVEFNTSKSTPDTVYIETTRDELDRETYKRFDGLNVVTVTVRDTKTGKFGYLHLSLDVDNRNRPLARVRAHGKTDTAKTIHLKVDLED
tara:strand:- start:211 stop:480 length:270 start_codon:yes stop_codon:yes gene_type:complete